mmetsp:Transcript_72365/g.172843  ORF Transcript_72365/g.172843 Transcript_72365/m.172843 type:complete len:208 (+) Transcript_72365:330-953(+)
MKAIHCREVEDSNLEGGGEVGFRHRSGNRQGAFVVHSAEGGALWHHETRRRARGDPGIIDDVIVPKAQRVVGIQVLDEVPALVQRLPLFHMALRTCLCVAVVFAEFSDIPHVHLVQSWLEGLHYDRDRGRKAPLDLFELAVGPVDHGHVLCQAGAGAAGSVHIDRGGSRIDHHRHSHVQTCSLSRQDDILQLRLKLQALKLTGDADR